MVKKIKKMSMGKEIGGAKRESWANKKAKVLKANFFLFFFRGGGGGGGG